MADFLWYALLAGLGVAIIAGPLGAFVVWQRMAYFGDTLAHSALIGVSLGLLLSINISLAITLSSAVIAILLLLLNTLQRASTDTLLGILSHSALSVGLIIISLFHTSSVDLTGYLLGDILATTPQDIFIIYTTVVLSGLLIIINWRSLLAVAIDENLAAAEGVQVKIMQLLLMLLLALMIAISMKIVGVLLITALLIIPAATSRHFAKTPEQMAILASIIGCLCVVGGLYASYLWDTPVGPSIVATASLLFVGSLLITKS